jgi:hypothetical protein
MPKSSYKQQLQEYVVEAYAYFDEVGICPCPEEIVDYVADCVEDVSGCEVDDAGYKGIAKRLGITLE